MAINLQKGQRISLSKEAPGLTKMMCGLGWDVAKKSGGGFFSGPLGNKLKCLFDFIIRYAHGHGQCVKYDPYPFNFL